MINKFSYFVLYSWIFISCSISNKSDNGIPKVDSTKFLYDELINPEKVRYINDKLIVLERANISSENPPVHVINSNNMKYQFSLGQIGFGPGEISDANNVDYGIADNSISVYSSIDKKISEFSLEDRGKLALSQLKQVGDFYKAYSVLRFSDTTFLALMVDSPHRLVEFDLNGNQKKYFGSLENFTGRNDLDDFNLSQINMGWFSSNKNRSHYAIACIFSNKIEIFNAQKEKLTMVFSGEMREYTGFELKPDIAGQSVFWDLNSPYFFRDVVFSNDYILALFGGTSEAEIQSSSKIANRVLIYSLAGELITEIELDVSVKSIAVDDEMTRIFGVTTDRDPGIVEFKLGDIF